MYKTVSTLQIFINLKLLQNKVQKFTKIIYLFLTIYIGEGNGNPLLCSCLENPRDGGAWWAAVYGVAQSRTRLKRLSSSSSNHIYVLFYTSVQFSHSVMSDSLQPHGLQHARLPSPSPTPGACSNSCSLSQ